MATNKNTGTLRIGAGRKSKSVWSSVHETKIIKNKKPVLCPHFSVYFPVPEAEEHQQLSKTLWEEQEEGTSRINI